MTTISPHFFVRTHLLPIPAVYPTDFDSLSQAYQNDPALREMILVASSDLYHSIEQNERILTDKTYSALRKYVLRASHRPTPYGLFAGTLQGTFASDDVDSVDKHPVRKRTRPDMEWLYRVILLAEQAVGAALGYRLNASVRERGVKLINLWDVALHQVLQEVTADEPADQAVKSVLINRTKAVELVLQACGEKGCSLSELHTLLREHYPTVDAQVFERFLADLIKKEYLISELRQSLADVDQLAHVMDILATYTPEHSLLTALRAIGSELAHYDALPIGQGVDTYVSLVEQMRQVASSKNYLQVDSYRGGVFQLPLGVQADIESFVDCYQHFSREGAVDAVLDKHVSKFVEKYGYTEVALLDMVDNLHGIGLPEKVSPSTHTSTTEQLTKKHLLSQLFTNPEVLNIGDDLLSSLQDLTPPKHLHEPAFDVAFHANQLNTGEFQYAVSPLQGRSFLGQSMGRFFHLHPEFDKTSLKNNRDKSFLEVELSFLPKRTRTANVMICESLRDMQLNFSVQNSQRLERLDIHDIRVGVAHGKFYFRSAKHDAALHFMMTSSVNPAFAPVLFRFLLQATQYQYRSPFALFGTLSKVKEGYTVFPRIVYKNLILSPKRWLLDGQAFSPKGKVLAFADFCTALASYATKYVIPSAIVLSEMDNLLPLDLTNMADVNILYRQYKKNPNLELQENLIPSGTDYHNEYVFFAQPAPTADPVPAVPSQPLNTAITYAPFDTWLYLKLYLPVELMDEVLATYISPFAEQLRAEGLAKRMFFIRYQDDSPHLRVRFEHCHQLDTLLKAVGGFTADLMKKALLSHYTIDSYEQETTRYGGQANALLAESVFCQDSAAVLHTLAELERKQWHLDKEAIFLLSMYQFLMATGLEQAELLAMLANDAAKKAYKVDFGMKRKKYLNLLNHPEQSSDVTALFTLLDKRTTAIQKLYTHLPQPRRADVTLSLIHMYFNRLIGINRALENRYTSYLEQLLFARQGYLKHRAEGK